MSSHFPSQEMDSSSRSEAVRKTRVGQIERSPSPASRGSSFGRAKLGNIAATARHHGLAAIGPLGVSAAHFVASIALLRILSGVEFGQFSFAIVVSALCIGVVNALLCAPLSSLAQRQSGDHLEELHACFKTALPVTAATGLATFGVMFASGDASYPAALFGIYGGAMALRLFTRSWAYWSGRTRSVVLSDMAYSLSLLLGLAIITLESTAHILAVAVAMAVSSVIAVFTFGRPLAELIAVSVRKGSLRAYRRIWRDMTRWSLAGVLTTEVSINAHAYLVTFICGPKAFALLAVGALFMRPFSLIATALPDQERPAMARSIAAGDIRGAFRTANGFLMAIGVVWCGTLAMAATILAWFPDFIIRKGYDRSSVISVVIWWAVITAVRGLRARDAVLLQAARAFRPLADASAKSCIIALAGALAFLMMMGPVASLAGILAGDVAMLLIIAAGVRSWRARASGLVVQAA